MGRPQQWWLGGRTGRLLLFVPGFLTGVDAYRDLLSPLAGPALQVGVVGFVPPGPRALLGRTRPQREAELVAGVAAEAIAEGREVWLGGHSRGGQVAWRAAEAVAAAGLVVVDPVDGQGPRSGPDATTRAPAFTLVPTIVALGEPSRCAPAALGPRAFAAADPRARLVVLEGAGHADVLGGRWLRRARRLCPGAADPAAVRASATALLAAALAGEDGGSRISGF